MKENREQILVDLMFQLVLTSSENEFFSGKLSREKAEWVAEQLRSHGFDTKPCGASWGVLKEGITND